MSDLLTEDQVIQGFHSLLIKALTQATVGGLFTPEEIQRAGIDVQIGGPCLVLFYAALSSYHTPPDIRAPDQSFILNIENCPPSFVPFFNQWQQSVDPIQQLPSDARHSLALLLCGKEPEIFLGDFYMNLCSCLKSVAIEINQRRTFQLRYANDLQHALETVHQFRDTSGLEQGSFISQFKPVPSYEETELENSPPPIPIPAKNPTRAAVAQQHAPAQSPPIQSLPIQPPQVQSPQTQPPPFINPPAHPPQSQTPLIKNLDVIRETLYAALADALFSNPQLHQNTRVNSRMFFAVNCLAILDVCFHKTTPAGVQVVHLHHDSPRVIGLKEVPPYLAPLLHRLLDISMMVQEMVRDDTLEAVIRITGEQVATQEGVSSYETLRQLLLTGQAEKAENLALPERIVKAANAINLMALELGHLPGFRERQVELFKILNGT